jgi:hypothetical protein
VLKYFTRPNPKVTYHKPEKNDGTHPPDNT